MIIGKISVRLTESIIGEGSLLKACSIHRCVLGVRSRIENEVVLQDTLVMGSDYFESGEERELLLEKGGIPMGVGRGTTVKRAILDKNVRIGANVTIVNKDHVEEADRPEHGFYIRNGIVVVVIVLCIVCSASEEERCEAVLSAQDDKGHR